MKYKTLFNRAVAMAMALSVLIQPSTAFASEETQNPTSASAKVTYKGEAHYSVVVPTKIELKPDGTAEFNLRAEGELEGWRVGKPAMLPGAVPYFLPMKVRIEIYSVDEEGKCYPGCYLYQEGKEPIFAEFHEEINTIYFENYMKQEGIEKYKDIYDSYMYDACFVHFYNPLPTWVRSLTVEELDPRHKDDYAGMTQDQFSNCYFGYDMGTSVPITVNLEGNVPVPAGEWNGSVVIKILNSNGSTFYIDVCPEAQEAYKAYNEFFK